MMEVVMRPGGVRGKGDAGIDQRKKGIGLCGSCIMGFDLMNITTFHYGVTQRFFGCLAGLIPFLQAGGSSAWGAWKSCM